ncbi:MAG: thermonuclease family protein [Gammaproteobacteria bacterium]|nr:thermonuclease family protein [Gammaproteobacteria bacterium]
MVYDGDTLEFSDGDKLRLAGINTPETAREERPAEPFADAAHAELSRRAGPGVRLKLRLDQVRRDRYGRLLAHAFLEDGTNLQVALLERGLATTLVVPPNDWRHECYAEVEQEARSAGRGIWTLPRYQGTPADELSADARGFHIVTGTIIRVGESRNNVWLNLTRAMALRIPRQDLENFRGFDPRTLAGRRVEARGWVQKRKGELRITVRHPAALRMLD